MHRTTARPLLAALPLAGVLAVPLGPVGAAAAPAGDAAGTDRLAALYTAAAPASPARFRLLEELDRLGAPVPGRPALTASPAAFRAIEEAGRP